MSSTRSVVPGLIGSQRPRVWSAPSAPMTAGPEAVDLARTAGLELLPWESWVCEIAMRQRADERWAAFEVLLLVSRQNGKGTCIEVMELYVLFVLGLNVFHTAHLMKTSRKAFKRLWLLIERTPALRRRVAGRPHVTAEEIVITLVDGTFIVFMARGQRAGRGLDDCDVLVLDEALFLAGSTTEAIVPTMSTRPNPQVWYTSSAGVASSTLLRALRDRGAAGDPGMCYLDWSIEPPTRDNPLVDPLDPAVVCQANPSLGALITMDYVRSEYALFTSEGKLAGWLRERMGVFDEDPAAAKRVIPAGPWRARGGLVDERPVGSVSFAVAAAWPDAEWASITVSGALEDGDTSVQLVERRPGTSWVVPRLVDLDADHENDGVVIDEAGPAGNLVDDAREAGLTVITPTAREVAHASKDFLAGLGAIEGNDPYLRHYDQVEMTAAAAAASRRPLGDAWTWQRRGEVDISPLEAATLAAWCVATHRPHDVSPPLGVPPSDARSETADLARMGF